jgi:short-subunit dehydrogenase
VVSRQEIRQIVIEEGPMGERWTLPSEPSVLVTGASSGIGEATAYRFARDRGRLGLIARRGERLARVAARVRELGGVAKVEALDVSDESALKAAIGEIESAHSGVDVLVNNAGFGLYAPLETVKRDDLERVFSVNTFGALSAIQAVLPGMRRRGRGLIVNVSSIVGKRALPMSGAYAATKYALQGLSDALRIELAGTGVEVSVICPGYTATEFGERVIDYGFARSQPRGGVMSAEDVAEAIFDCARHPRREIVLTGKGRLVVFLERFAPSLADFVIRRAVRVELPQ